MGSKSELRAIQALWKTVRSWQDRAIEAEKQLYREKEKQKINIESLAAKMCKKEFEKRWPEIERILNNGDAFLEPSVVIDCDTIKAEQRCEKIRESARHWKMRALDAEHRCDLIRASARQWKSRAIEAEKRYAILEDEREKSGQEMYQCGLQLRGVKSMLQEKSEKLAEAYKALDDAQKQLQQAREDLRSANEDYQAQHLELLSVKANAYDLLTGGTRV